VVAQAFGSAQQITVVVGPEGGITETELADFEQVGAHRVRLGNEILRTSTAGVAALSAIQAIIGSWS
jgi:16S rRNA (uracil1498-N3)-methyltransferase